MSDQEYDFALESDHLAHISEVIIYLKQYMEENPVRYPPAMLAYVTLTYGLVPVIKVNCPSDSQCEVNGGAPCGGLVDAIESLDNAFECIDLEMDMQSPSYVYPSDYSI